MNDAGVLKPIAILALLVCILLAFGTGSCTDESNTHRTLAAHGFTDVRTMGYGWFACGQHDTFATKFTAKNPKGQHVEGAVCCGLLKNCTVRF